MNIVTRRTSNVNGTSQVVAKAEGKQKTTNWDPAKSTDWNHGNAAGALVLHMDKAMDVLDRLDNGRGLHDSSDDGQRHVFTL